MDASVLMLQDWRRATAGDHAAAGRQIAAALKGVSFERVEETSGGCRTAIFTVDDEEFAFVPGGEVTLGYATGMFALSKSDVDALCETGEYDGEEEVRAAEADLRETLAMVLSPRRSTRVAPLLVETEAAAVDEQPLAENDPIFAEMARGLKPGGTASREIDGVRYRAFSREGRVEVLERAPLAHISRIFSEHVNLPE